MINETLKSFGVSTLAAGVFGVADYKERKERGEGTVSTIFNTLMWNVLPSVLFTGGGFLADLAIQGAWNTIPAIPAIVGGLYSYGQAAGVYQRKSALPFSGYGYMPTAGAIGAMQRGMEAMGGARGITQAHAALASQAMRR